MNDEPFQTLAGPGESEHTVDRSRFLGLARPIASLEAALGWVDEIRGEHYDARHVCYGLRIGRGAQGIDRSNDDGEPARTGGYPLWQLLDGEDLTDAILVVVRYYGGIKLGTGGLARAYREAGRLAIDDAGIRTVYPETNLNLTIPYTLYDRLIYLVEESPEMRVVNVEYAADIALELAVRKVDEAQCRALLGQVMQQDPDDL